MCKTRSGTFKTVLISLKIICICYILVSYYTTFKYMTENSEMHVVSIIALLIGIRNFLHPSQEL